MMVIMRAVVGFTAIRGGLELGGQRRGPLFPGEMALLGELDGQRERLGLPRLGENGPALIARQGRKRLDIRRAQDSPPTSRYRRSPAQRPARPTARARRSARSRHAGDWS